MLKSFFNKIAGLMVCNFIKGKKLWHRCFPVSLLFKRTYFVEHVRTNAWVIWTKNIAFTKSIYRKTPAMASFLVQLQTCGLTVFQNGPITDALLWKLGILENINFTEQCWATASDFQWHFQCITCPISDKWVHS